MTFKELVKQVHNDVFDDRIKWYQGVEDAVYQRALQSMVLEYNDTDLRTKEEVVSLVQAAIGDLGKAEVPS